MKTVLVTGAAGFVGSHLCAALARAGFRVRAAVRRVEDASRIPAPHPDSLEIVPCGTLSGNTDWRQALRDVDSVVHLAARVHVMVERAGNTGDAYREANVAVTRRLAEQSAERGVRRLVFVSSVKVNGEGTAGRPYSASDEPAPVDPYALSKLEAERALRSVAADSSLEYAIVRPPLVYGPGVHANFLRLLRLAESGMPLPFGAIRNRRSLISVWNLCDLIACLVDHPRASGGTWLASDGEDLSTPELVARLAGAMGHRARMVPVPETWLRWAGNALHRGAEVERLCGSLQIDPTPLRRELGWSAPLSVDEALERTVRWYLDWRVAA